MSQEIQSDLSSNHSDEFESEYIFNRPLEYPLGSREKYVEIGLPLYKASIKCDWKAADAILDKNRDMNLLRRSITENGETALHVAASVKAPKKVGEFVYNLVGKMENEELELVDNNHSTALYLAAAAGNTETVKIMMERNPTLDTIPGDGRRMMPLYAAVLFGNKDVARHLYFCSKDLGKDGWNHANRSRLLEKCVEGDMFDIAIEIVKKYPDLGRRSYSLGLLARKPEAFHEKKSSNTESNIKSVSAFIGGYKAETRVDKNDALSLLGILWENIVTLSKTDMDHILRGPPDSIKSSFGRIHQTRQLKALIFSRLEKLEKEINEIMEGTQPVSNLKDLISKYVLDMHFETQSLIKKEYTTDEDQALDLQKLISEYIVKLHDETEDMPANGIFENRDLAWRLKYLIFEMRSETNKIDTRSYSSRVLFIAAEVGNINFLLELFRRSPDLVWKLNDNNQTIFHVAVKHRHEGIYNLLYLIDSKKDKVTPLKDNDGNNMLHLAAMRTSKKNHEDIPGAALQMQRELLWFKKVERMIPPSYRVSKNKDGLTPRELFTMEHQYLIYQGERWMKETASQCMVVATLIATIVFAAAFTVPGGYNQNDGIPMFNRKLSFAVFVVADAMSLFLSSTSILIFLSFFISSRYAEHDFEGSLQRKLILGLATLFLSIGTMMVAFCVSFFLLYHREMKWIPIFISSFAFIPAILYVALQSLLLVGVFRSTYFLPARAGQYVLYENPTV